MERSPRLPETQARLVVPAMHGTDTLPVFQPHPLLASGHLQTLAGVLLTGRVPPYRAAATEIPLDDGDRIVVHDDQPAEWQRGGRVALLVHGLGGSFLSPYMVRAAAKLCARHVRVFRMDMRGCGAAGDLCQHPGHAGRSEDLAAALTHVARHCPGSSIVLVGFSLGGNLVLKLLAEAGRQLPWNVPRAVAVCPPLDLARSSQHMLRPASRWYARHFVRLLMRKVNERRAHVPRLAELPLAPWPRSLQEFDDRFTAPLSGFSGADEYYQKASSAPLLPQIHVPTRILAAADDPLVPVHIFSDARLSHSTLLHITDHGGHVGWIGVSGVDPDRRWLDWRVVEWVTQAESRVAQPGEVIGKLAAYPAAATL